MKNEIQTPEKLDRKRRILFVDDEPRVLDGLRRLLRSERAQWEMTFVSGVDEALQVLNEEDHDAVISDVNMPVRDGFDLLACIQADVKLQDIPVVILTGNGEPDLKRRAIELGAADLLAKPVAREDLVARIRSVLRLKDYTDQIKSHGQELERRVQERTRELEFSRAELIWRLGKAGEFRDSNTGFHVVRVGYYSQQLAVALGLSANVSREIFLSAPLHDIGKIGIPDNILLKPGKLTTEEMTIMKTHAVIGGQILRSEPAAEKHVEAINAMTGMGAVASNPLVKIGSMIAESHHERWDGGGYPHGLAGEEIPIAARITSIADVFDALGSERPYKPALGDEEVLGIMRNGIGDQFDPEVFQAFEDSLHEFGEIRERFKDEDVSEPQADIEATLEDL